MSFGVRTSALSFVVRVVPLAVAVGLLSCAGRSATPTTPAVAQTFEVRLYRPAAVGRRGRLRVEAEKHMTTRFSINGQFRPDEHLDLQVHFLALEEVVSLTPSGAGLESRFTLERLETEDAQGTHELAHRGQVVTVVRGARWPDARVTIDGHPVEEPVLEALGMAVSMATGSATDDEIFGTARRHPIGASWPVHGERALRDLQDAVGVPAIITGRTRLNARETVEGTDCLDVSVEMHGTFTDTRDLPPNVNGITGTIHETQRGMYPVEVSAPRLVRVTMQTMELVHGVRPDASRGHEEYYVTLRRSQVETFTPLPH